MAAFSWRLEGSCDAGETTLDRDQHILTSNLVINALSSYIPILIFSRLGNLHTSMPKAFPRSFFSLPGNQLMASPMELAAWINILPEFNISAPSSRTHDTPGLQDQCSQKTNRTEMSDSIWGSFRIWEEIHQPRDDGNSSHENRDAIMAHNAKSHGY